MYKMPKKYTIKSRIWIEDDAGTFLAEGRIMLLKKILELGSISKAAQFMNMSYSKAWQQIKNMNNSARKPMIIKKIGGKNGGGTVVSAYGKNMIAHYDRLQQNCKEFLSEEIKKINF